MKRNIKINRAPISSEEILKGKNFSELTKTYTSQVNTPTKPFYKKGWFGTTVASVTLITTAVVILNSNSKTKENIINDNNLSVLSDTAQTKFINPPAPGIDVKKDRYFVNAGTGGKIIHHTGTEIEIPKHSFVKEDGSPVTGEVEIQYREFHDQIDIFFSGIPMEYDSAGTKYNFESAGMMEIYAFQNGEKLKIAPNKELNVSMTSYNPDTKFNLYYLDEEAKNWDYRGKDSIVNEQDFTFSPSPIDNNEMIDDNLFTEKKEAIKEQEQVVEVIKKDIAIIEKAKPIKPLKAQKNVHSFDIDVNKEEFPEIAEYQGTIFEVIDQVNFDAKIYDIQWEDIVLKQNNNNLCIELTKGKQTKKIDVKPVLEGENYTVAIKEFSKKFDTYSKKLATRKSDEEKALAELKNRREAYEEQRKNLINSSKAYTKREISEGAITRIFNINKVGTWNCDSPLKYIPNGKKVLAKYTDAETNQEVNLTSLSLIEKARNAKWPISSMQNGIISFNPKAKNFLCGVTKNGDIAIAKPINFKEAKNMKAHSFKMQIINYEEVTIDDIKKLIKA